FFFLFFLDFIYHYFCFFFLLIRRPPRSTLFPYTRSSDLLYKMRPRQTVAAEFGHPAWDIPRCIFRSVFCAAYGSSSQCNFAWIRDRKSTRLNSSHVSISYAVFCLKKKKKKYNILIYIYTK